MRPSAGACGIDLNVEVPDFRMRHHVQLATHLYGFQFRFTVKPPHHQMDVFDSLNSVMSWVDPHQERGWEEAGMPTKLG
jgi:hypothetical protein